MRTLHIGVHGEGYKALPLSDKYASPLLARGVVYDCGNGHDLHLAPDHQFTLEDVEALCLGLANQTPWKDSP